MAPGDPAEEAELYAAVRDLPIAGLEAPLLPEDHGLLSPAWRERNLDPAWDLLVTCIPTVMHRLGDGDRYGLASTDHAAREAALADVARARDLARTLAEEQGRPVVTGIQVHSAPGPGRGSLDSLRRSLTTLAGWDLAGARLLLEHCDARVEGQDAAKGFLTLDEEIATLEALGPDARIGLSINWGRSAIEGRSAQTPVDHARAARDARLLGALVLSGAADTETAWGPAWSDAHIPPRGPHPALARSSGSLLDVEQVRRTLVAAGPVPVAVKVAVRPSTATVDERVAVARASLALLEDARG
ncbi:DUF4862 family protein [Actinotalea sp. BY-33]|uniref:DUF4862 family protein n=2 Tax=Actinotalea soli TaxID=2819234 RepID=A0A939RWB3_9CELL|nr:DUF4862 family protein [Actinotalea soli]